MKEKKTEHKWSSPSSSQQLNCAHAPSQRPLTTCPNKTPCMWVSDWWMAVCPCCGGWMGSCHWWVLLGGHPSSPWDSLQRTYTITSLSTPLIHRGKAPVWGVLKAGYSAYIIVSGAHSLPQSYVVGGGPWDPDEGRVFTLTWGKGLYKQDMPTTQASSHLSHCRRRCGTWYGSPGLDTEK